MRKIDIYSIQTRGFTSVTRLVVGFLMAASTYTVPASAQGTAAAAETLFQQGRDEMTQGNYESACAKLRQSDELDPALGTKLNLADCESKRGKLATAWELFKAVEEKLDPKDSRYPIAKQKRQALEPQLPKLVITLAPGAPANTTVREGTAVLGTSAFGIELPLDPGHHELLVSAAGCSDAKFAVELAPGKTAKVEVAPGAPTAPAAAPATTLTPTTTMMPTTTTQTRAASGTKTLGYVFGGIGVAGLVVGGVSGILTLSAKSTNDKHCDAATRTCDSQGRDAASSGRLFGAMTTAGLATGVVGLGLGTYFLVKSSKSSDAQTALMTQVGPAGTGLSLVHQW